MPVSNRPYHLRKRFVLLCAWVCLMTVLPISANATEPLHVFVSVLPQRYFAQQIGGEQVQVETMVQPGFSPETYEPNARQISALSKADLYVRIGMPFEAAWIPRIQAVNKTMTLLDARTGLNLKTMAAHEHAEADGHEDAHTEDEHAKNGTELDAHIWTSPRMVKHMAAQLRDAFSQLRPEQADLFSANYTHFAAELDTLDAELTALFADKNSAQAFMVFHPAWGYLADAYGLTQIPIEAEGKEPGAKALTALIEQAQQNGVKTLFVQPQFSQRAAEQIAKAIDGKVVSIDPLAEDYPANLHKVARLIAGVTDE